MATKKIEHQASKGHFLTLDELGAFVREALRNGADGGEVVHARVSFGSKLQRLAIDVPQAATAPADGTR
ncbi:hypothetical protein [Streptomyces sp. NRRL S-1813]|uniref:hypothetical protein n=1 Tax=Streptomyces sp. NRRL S-1813 TaxID=1463888 RepID=UPI0004C5D95C|nr:hypothetical protein [Streptomyces sp. NRRL S-1813]